MSNVDKSLLEIYTGRGLLSKKELQQEGKKRLPIEEFLNGNDISDKDIFLNGFSSKNISRYFICI